MCVSQREREREAAFRHWITVVTSCWWRYKCCFGCDENAVFQNEIWHSMIRTDIKGKSLCCRNLELSSELQEFLFSTVAAAMVWQPWGAAPSPVTAQLWSRTSKDSWTHAVRYCRLNDRKSFNKQVETETDRQMDGLADRHIHKQNHADRYERTTLRENLMCSPCTLSLSNRCAHTRARTHTHKPEPKPCGLFWEYKSGGS